MSFNRETVLRPVLPALLAAALAAGCAAGSAKRTAPGAEPPGKAGPATDTAASVIPVVAVVGIDGKVRRVKGPGPVIARARTDKPDTRPARIPATGRKDDAAAYRSAAGKIIESAIPELRRAVEEAVKKRVAGGPGSPPAEAAAPRPSPEAKAKAAGGAGTAGPQPPPAPPASIRSPLAAGIEVAVETVRGMRTWLLPPGRWRALAWAPDGALALTPVPAGPRMGVGLMVRGDRESMVVSVAGREVEVPRGGAAEVTVARPDGGMERMTIFLPRRSDEK